MEIPGQLTCLLRNLYAGQETAVRIRHRIKCYAQVAKSPIDHQGADIWCKTRAFLLLSSCWGSHWYRRSGYWEEPPVLGYIAYIGYSRARNLKNGSFRVGRHLIGYLLWKGYVLVSDWFLLSRADPGFWLVPISWAGHGFWLVPIT